VGYGPWGYAAARPPIPRGLRRNTTNRCLGGVLGGLADYLGVEASVLRVGFVLASVMFLAGFGGAVLYLVAWALIPEDRSPLGQRWPAGPAPWWDRSGSRSGPGWHWQTPTSWPSPGSPAWSGDRGPWGPDGAQPSWERGRPSTWQAGETGSPMWLPGPSGPDGQASSDRAARSWALVLGACALAIAWSFGIARWWHSGAVLAWLFVVWVAVGLFVRSGCRGSWAGLRTSGGGAAPSSAGDAAGAFTGRAASTMQGAAPAAPAESHGPSDVASPGSTTTGTTLPAAGGSLGDVAEGPGSGSGGQFCAGRAASDLLTPGPAGGPSGLGNPGPEDVRHGTEGTEWAEAQAMAASWAAEQLAAAGLAPSQPSSGHDAAWTRTGGQAALGASAGAPTATGTRSPYARRHRRKAVMAALLAGFVLAVLVSVVGVSALSGASLVGGVGDVTAAPAALNQTRSHYRLGIGRLEVDVSRVRFPLKGRTIVASVGVGQLVIVLPPRTVVELDATSAVGGVHLPGNALSEGTEVTISQPAGLSRPSQSSGSGKGGSMARRPPHLTVDARVGVGEVDVLWG